VKITPHEILHYFGFDVPPEGIEISPNESRLYIEALRALGETVDVSAIPEAALANLYNESMRLIRESIDVSTIPDSLLQDLNDGYTKLVLACRNGESFASRRLDLEVADLLYALVVVVNRFRTQQ
jgi:hypothetical protein